MWRSQVHRLRKAHRCERSRLNLPPEQLEENLIFSEDGADIEAKSATGLEDAVDIATQSITEKTLEMESEPFQSLKNLEADQPKDE